MRKAQVRLGGRYEAKISGKIVVVRLTNENPHGGWNAINESTGRTVRIKTAAKLRCERGPKGLEDLLRF